MNLVERFRAGRDGQSVDRLPVLALKSNYSSVKHRDRLVTSARELGITRFAWLKFLRGVLMPNLYWWLPEMHAAHQTESEIRSH